MYRDVEIRDMGMTSLIEKDIIRFQIPCPCQSRYESDKGRSPMYNLSRMQVIDRHGDLRYIETDHLLIHGSGPVEVD